MSRKKIIVSMGLGVYKMILTPGNKIINAVLPVI